MQSIFVLFIAFVGIGLFSRNFNSRVRLLVFLVVMCVVTYVTINVLRTP